MNVIISIGIIAVILVILFINRNDGKTTGKHKNKRNSEDTVFMSQRQAWLKSTINSIKKNIRF